MSSWILQHFLNPAFFWPGMLLVSVPVIIHLINRMRYRRVRFAAMDFLFASQKKNQRRVLIEELLLLLLRMLMILFLVGLIARLIVDPSQLSLFQGAKSHHLVILDDTASMQDRMGNEVVFDRAKEVVQRLVAEGAANQQSQLFTLLLMSRPNQTLTGLSEADLTEDLLVEITDRMSILKPTYQAADPATALEIAKERLADDPAAVRHVHLVSDFRHGDWIENKAAISLMNELGSSGIRLNLVRCVAESRENLGISHLGGQVQVAAAGVPVTLEAAVRNWGTRIAEDVRAELFIDGVRVPRTIDFLSIPPGEESSTTFEVVFPTAEPHEVKLSIREDALEADNQRFLAVDVPEDNPILLVDGSPATEQAYYIADALAANKSVTGFDVQIQTPEDLRRTPLEHFDLIYLINVPELTPDVVAALDDYVRSGGGLVWYLGDAVRPAFYNQSLFASEEPLFPIRIGIAPEVTDRSSSTATSIPDITPANTPLFALLSNAEVPILDLVFVNLAYAPADADPSQPSLAKEVEVLATLRNRQPLFLSHRLGQGRIVTCLTSAGPLLSPEGLPWTNWANGPASFSFAVFQLELAKSLVRTDRKLNAISTGQPISLRLNQADYESEIELISPDDQVERILATPTVTQESDTMPTLDVIIQDTDLPGVYEASLLTTEQTRERRLFAANVPDEEGDLQLMESAQLLNALSADVEVEIQDAGSFDWIRSDSPGSDVRWYLLVCLALLCIAEQVLASRLSYIRS